MRNNRFLQSAARPRLPIPWANGAFVCDRRDGKRVEQWYGSGEDILAVAYGTVVSIHDRMPDKSCVNYCPSKRLYRRLNT